jgi:WD repeat-containing protein 19
MIKDDFSACPKCDFPALYSEFMKYLECEVSCPMCSSNISRNDVKKISDIEKYLKINEEKS